MSLNQVEIEQEPEAQFAVPTQRVLQDIEKKLVEMGAQFHKEQDGSDDCTYFDTKNFRLAREGIEARGKWKGKLWRLDLKTPIDTQNRIAVPDEYGVVDRMEIKCFQEVGQPQLSAFLGQSVLKPVAVRVKGFFGKNLEPKFKAPFQKRKFLMEYVKGDETAIIEYSLQVGRMTSLDGEARTPELFIAEVELKDGSRGAYNAAVSDFAGLFCNQGVQSMQERKWQMGLRLCAQDATGKARRNLEIIFARMKSYIPSILALKAA